MVSGRGGGAGGTESPGRRSAFLSYYKQALGHGAFCLSAGGRVLAGHGPTRTVAECRPSADTVQNAAGEYFRPVGLVGRPFFSLELLNLF